MKVTENDNIITVDVDDTLVIWDIPQGRESECVLFNNFGYAEWLLPHEAHIKLLKQFKVRGHYIIVWSQGGYEWAKAVVETLGLTEWVDEVKTKPKWYIDDLPSTAWMKRTYLDLEGKRMPCKDVETVDWEEVDEEAAFIKGT
jgi:hypothetical protein